MFKIKCYDFIFAEPAVVPVQTLQYRYKLYSAGTGIPVLTLQYRYRYTGIYSTKNLVRPPAVP
jgi:hypothetical protein